LIQTAGSSVVERPFENAMSGSQNRQYASERLSMYGTVSEGWRATFSSRVS
jgi:hypothetical protein